MGNLLCMWLILSFARGPPKGPTLPTIAYPMLSLGIPLKR